jgi:hypothetical protein
MGDSLECMALRVDQNYLVVNPITGYWVEVLARS